MKITLTVQIHYRMFRILFSNPLTNTPNYFTVRKKGHAAKQSEKGRRSNLLWCLSVLLSLWVKVTGTQTFLLRYIVMFIHDIFHKVPILIVVFSPVQYTEYS